MLKTTNKRVAKKKIKNTQKKSGIVIAKKSNLYVSTGGSKFTFSEDTIRRVLHENKDMLYKNNNWVGLLCAAVSCTTVMFVSDFKPRFGLNADVIFGIYITVCALFWVWTFVSGIKAILHRSNDMVTDIVERLKDCSVKAG